MEHPLIPKKSQAKYALAHEKPPENAPGAKKQAPPPFGAPPPLRQQEESGKGASAQKKEKREDEEVTQTKADGGEKEPIEAVQPGTIQQKEKEEEALQQKSAEEEESVQKKQARSFTPPEFSIETDGGGPLQQKSAGDDHPAQTKTDRNKTFTPSGESGGAGGPLGPAQQKMESAFNADFSNVNVHANSKSASDIGALAYAQGNDVHFAPGQFKPDTKSGQELIGHELTHIIQQREKRVAPTTQSRTGMPVNDDKGLESEADQMGAKAARGESTGMNGGGKTSGANGLQLKAAPAPSAATFQPATNPIQEKSLEEEEETAQKKSEPFGLEMAMGDPGPPSDNNKNNPVQAQAASFGTVFQQKSGGNVIQKDGSGETSGIIPALILLGNQLDIDLSTVEQTTTLSVSLDLVPGVVATSLEIVIEEAAFASGKLVVNSTYLSGIDFELNIDSTGAVHADLVLKHEINGFEGVAHAQLTPEGVQGNLEVQIPANHPIIAGLKTTGGSLYLNFAKGASAFKGDIGVVTDDGLVTGAANVSVDLETGDWSGSAQLQSEPRTINVAPGADILLPEGFAFSARFGGEEGLVLEGESTVVPQVTLQSSDGIEAGGTAEIDVKLGASGLEFGLKKVRLAVTGGLNAPEMNEVLEGQNLTADVDAGGLLTLWFTDSSLSKIDLEVTGGINSAERRIGRLSFAGQAQFAPFSFIGMLHAVTNAAFTLVEGTRFSTAVMAGSQLFVSLDNTGISNVDASLGLEVAEQQAPLARLTVASSFPRGQGLSLVAQLELLKRLSLSTAGENGFGVDILPTAGLGAKLENGVLTEIQGSLPLEVADQEGPLLAGNLEGLMSVSDSEQGISMQDGAASATLLRDLAIAMGSAEVRILGGTGVNLKFEGGKLISLAGDLAAVYDNGTRTVALLASVDYDPNEKILRSLDASLKTEEVFSLFGGKLEISELEGGISIRNNQLISIGGHARLDALVGDFTLSGEADVTWSDDGEETAFVGAGWLQFSWYEEEESDKYLNGRVDVTIDGKDFTLLGSIEMGLMPGLTGEATVAMDQEMDPIISAALTYSTVLMEASELWAMEFGLGIQIPIVPVLVNLEAGILFGMSVNTRPLMVFGTVGVENWKPKSSEFPDFFAELRASWGLDIEAKAMAYLELILGIDSVLNLTGGVRAGVGLNIPIELAPHIALHGGSEGIWGEMGLDLSLAPVLKLLIDAYLKWEVLGIWDGEKIWNLMDQQLADLGDFEWSGSFAFGDKQEPEGDMGGVQQQVAEPTGSPISVPEGLNSDSSLGFGNQEQAPDSPVGLSGLTDGMQVPGAEGGEESVDQEGLGGEFEKVGMYADGIAAVGDLIGVVSDGFKSLVRGGPIGFIIWMLFKKPSKSEIQEKKDRVEQFRQGLTGDNIIAPDSMVNRLLGLLSGEYNFWIIFDKSKPYRDMVDRGMHRDAMLEDRAEILEGMIKGWTGEKDESRIIEVLDYTLSNEGAAGVRELTEYVGGPGRIRDQYEFFDRNDKKDLDRIFGASYGSNENSVEGKPTYTAKEGATVKRTGRSWEELAVEAYGHPTYATYILNFSFNQSQISQEEAYQDHQNNNQNNNNNTGGGPPTPFDDDTSSGGWNPPTNTGPARPDFIAYIPKKSEIVALHEQSVWQERFIVPGMLEYAHWFENYEMIARFAYGDANYDNALKANNLGLNEIEEGSQVILPSVEELGPPWIEVPPVALGSSGMQVWVSPDSNKQPEMWMGTPDRLVAELAQEAVDSEETKAAAEQLLAAATFNSNTTQVDAENAVSVARGLIDFILASIPGSGGNQGAGPNFEDAQAGDTLTIGSEKIGQLAEIVYGHAERAAWIIAFNATRGGETSGNVSSASKGSAASGAKLAVSSTANRPIKLPTWSEMNALDPLPATARGVAPKSIIEAINGDTWANLAQKAYGDWSKAVSLAEFSANAGLNLAAGATVNLPSLAELNSVAYEAIAQEATLSLDKETIGGGPGKIPLSDSTDDAVTDERDFSPGSVIIAVPGDTWSALAIAAYDDFALFVKLANHPQNIPFKTLPDGASIYLPTLDELEDVPEFGLGLAPTGNPLLTEMVRIPTDDELHHVWAENQASEGSDPLPVWMMASIPTEIAELVGRWRNQFADNSEMLGKIDHVESIKGAEISGDAVIERKTELQDINNAADHSEGENGEGQHGGDSGVRAFVTPFNGIRLYDAPNPSAPKMTTVYPKGSEVTVLDGYAQNPGWAYIQAPDCSEGWIELRFLQVLAENAAFDSLTQEFYFVNAGDQLGSVIEDHYPDYDYKTGNDMRTICEALVKLNLESGLSKPIYFDDSHQSFFDDLKNTVKAGHDPTMAYSRFTWQNAKLRISNKNEGAIIRLPSVAYIDLLRENGDVGTRPEWMNNAIGAGQIMAGFLAGVGIGFVEAGIGAVTGIWDLLKGIVTGSLFKAIWDFIKKLGEEGISVIWDMISDVYNGARQALEDAWNNPNPYQKGEFFGKVVGNILFEIAIAFFTAGVGTAIKNIPKVAKIIDKIPSFGKVADDVADNLRDHKRGGKGDDVVRSVASRKGSQIAQELGFDGPPADGYQWVRTVDGELSIRREAGSNMPKRALILDADGNIEFKIENGKKKPKLKKVDPNKVHADVKDLETLDDSKLNGLLDDSNLSPQQKLELENLMDERESLIEARKAAKKKSDEFSGDKHSDEYKRHQQEMREASHKLGEKAGEIYMRSKGGTKLFPEGDVGDVSRAGEFDQVWKVGDEVFIVEAKGGFATRGTRQVGGQVVEQGTQKYMDDILRVMKTKHPDLVDEIEMAKMLSNLKYVEVRQKITAKGDLGAIDIKEYNF